MTMSRRDFVGRAGAAAAGFAGLRAGVLSGALTPSGLGELEGTDEFGFGPLVRDPNGVFDLPAGFAYTIISERGQVMDDGLLTPGKHDGMAAFSRPDGQIAVVCNHEVEYPLHGPVGPWGDQPWLRAKLKSGAVYDAGSAAMGGTTTVLYNPRTRAVEKRFMSLAGTVRNCAGGPTPWGSWLTCEETVVRKGDEGPGYFEQDHGYVFEVPSEADSIVEAKPIRALGRMNHEAVCVDPRTGIVYLTEDRSDGLIYRLIPVTPGQLHEGGKLQALAVRGRPRMHTQNWRDAEPPFPEVKVGERFECDWIDVRDVESPLDDLRLRGFEAGAARFARGEGMWWGAGPGMGAAYFACTNGGPANLGQIWRYTPGAAEGSKGEDEKPGVLELFIEPNDVSVLANADNVCVMPWGGLVVCEDGALEQQRLIGVSPRGKCFMLGRNVISASELAGCCFSPDGQTMFVNVQSPGMTLAIRGPWEKRRL